MHVALLSMGFTKCDDGSYFNNELCLRVSVIDNMHVNVVTFQGESQATLKELEDAIAGDGFGDY